MASKQSQGIPTTAITADLVGGEVYNPQQQHTQPWQIPVQTVQTHPGGENGKDTVHINRQEITLSKLCLLSSVHEESRAPYSKNMVIMPMKHKEKCLKTQFSQTSYLGQT